MVARRVALVVLPAVAGIAGREAGHHPVADDLGHDRGARDRVTVGVAVDDRRVRPDLVLEVRRSGCRRRGRARGRRAGRSPGASRGGSRGRCSAGRSRATDAAPTPIATARRRISGASRSRWAIERVFESRTPGIRWQFGRMTTAAATTAPQVGATPTSSTPTTRVEAVTPEAALEAERGDDDRHRRLG